MYYFVFWGNCMVLVNIYAIIDPTTIIVCVCIYVCVCVWEREREREREWVLCTFDVLKFNPFIAVSFFSLHCSWTVHTFAKTCSVIVTYIHVSQCVCVCFALLMLQSVTPLLLWTFFLHQGWFVESTSKNVCIFACYLFISLAVIFDHEGHKCDSFFSLFKSCPQFYFVYIASLIKVTKFHTILMKIQFFKIQNVKLCQKWPKNTRGLTITILWSARQMSSVLYFCTQQGKPVRAFPSTLHHWFKA